MPGEDNFSDEKYEEKINSLVKRLDEVSEQVYDCQTTIKAQQIDLNTVMKVQEKLVDTQNRSLELLERFVAIVNKELQVYLRFMKTEVFFKVVMTIIAILFSIWLFTVK